MQFLRQSWFGMSTVLVLVILFFTQCSDARNVQKDIIKEAINLNKHSEEKVVTKPTVEKNPEVEKFKKQRDDAVDRTSTIREKNALLQKKAEALNKKIEALKAIQEKEAATFHTKLAASSTDFLAAKALNDKLIKQRDEAIKSSVKEANNLQSKITQAGKDVKSEITTLQSNISQDRDTAKNLIEKKQRELDKLTTKLSHLEEKLTKLSDKSYELKNIISEKNAEISSTIYDKKDAIKVLKKKLDVRKDEEIQKLTKEKNEAIKVSLGMKNQLDSLTNKLSHLQEKLQSSLKDKQSLKGSLKSAKEEDKEKLSTSSSEVSNLKGIISNKNAEISRLTHDKERIERTLSRKIHDILEEQSRDNTLLKTKLASFSKLLTKTEDEVQKLTKQRDEALEACTK